jgi:hypothetical protein
VGDAVHGAGLGRVRRPPLRGGEQIDPARLQRRQLPFDLF